MNTKHLLKILGFLPKENSTGIFEKKYADWENYVISVDFEKETIDFGNQITAESKTTQNFSQAENWVVLECVDRLLEKGYNPKNIILEKTWASGHGTSGRLDICVTREDGSEYLLIECKTYGKEFDKAFSKLKKDGGQLFTYFKFSNKADLIMLYASEIQGDKVVPRQEIIKIEEEYRTGDVKDFYEKWNKLTKDNGIFDKWVTPYHFISKALTPKMLQPITQNDSSFIFNRFLEILRHNVVSDKPNAFNKIFTLFLCKVYDEKNTRENEELKFQWLEGQDDDVSFQLRLTDLYKNGMLEFLEKEVSDFSQEDFDKKYKSLDESVKKDILDSIVKLRLEKNNEFAIKEVFDNQSFRENAKVVKEVVELLQSFRLRYNKRQQYLSDFFELLLTTGLKQESGQFFTPVPIAQFIIKSLPIDDLVAQKLKTGKKNDLLPYIMDYAAGSGHFLTESMHEIQRVLDKQNDKDYIPDTAKKVRNWQDDHFDWATQYVYGVEKDYRLVKVGKVGCYLHGDGLANVILSDGLANFTHPSYKGKLQEINSDFPKENKQFDVLISNPPYSVASFKNASRDYYTEKDFELYEKLTDNSSEIECLFVERTKQLLKDGGIAGIILPNSILNKTGVFTQAREMILQYFEIIAIAEFGSNTFMETGTNTVTLFLRRRNNYEHINLKKFIEGFYKDFSDRTLNGIENAISKYVAHVWDNISFEDYISLLKTAPNESIQKHEVYQEYQKKIKAKTPAERWEKILNIEKEKLLYFVLAYPQKIVLIKTGQKKEEKRFLGYEFSKRRGGEGIHPIRRGKTIAECTQLFDEEGFENPQKASHYIYHAFRGSFKDIHEELEKNISYRNLADMMTFDSKNFDKSIGTISKKNIQINSKWEVVSLGKLIQTQYGYTAKADDTGEVRYLRITDITEKGNIKNQDKKFINPSQSIKEQYILKHDDIVVARSGSVGRSTIYKESQQENFIFASYLIRLKVDRTKLLADYLFLYMRTSYYWKQVEYLTVTVAQPNLNAEKIKLIKIPLPPKEIQEKIIKEIKELEEKAKTIVIKDIETKKEDILKQYL